MPNRMSGSCGGRLDWRRLVAVCLLIPLMAGCGSRAEPDDNEIYSAVVDKVAERLQLGPRIYLHPLVTFIRPEAQGGPLMGDFVDTDSVTVKSFAATDPARYRICTVNSTGYCLIAADEPWLVLSEIEKVGDNAALVGVMVRDTRSAERALRRYVARVTFGWRGEPEVRLEPLR